MKQFLLCILIQILCFAGAAFAQVSPYSLSPDWYFGQGGRLTFPTGNYPTSGAPAAGSMPTNNSTGVEASTSVCFNNGAVALYTNTQQVYNANPANAGWTDFIRSLTTDGKCAGSATGGAVAFPDPASPTNAFYLILPNDLTSGSCPNQGVTRYRFTGTGTTVAYNAGPVTMAPDAFAGEAITAGTDGTGGYWLVIHSKTTANTFRVWHFTAGGITGPTDYTVGAAVSDVSGSQSYLKISPCQDKIAYHSGGTLVVNNWNRTTGVVGAELRRITPADYGVGLEFSPDGSRVYYSGQGGTVNYVVIGTGATGSVAGSASWSLQLGPDGKIYTSPSGATSVGVISSPNAGPTYSTVALPGGASLFRGLSNIAWLTPGTPSINRTITNCSVDFSHLFRNYFLTNVGVNTGTFSWDFGDGNTSTAVAPTHVYAATGTYTVTLSFNDATCGHTWSASTSVTTSCPLPVDWLNISAVHAAGKVDVTWSTSKEQNNDHFDIQRSDDGVNFITIGSVKGKGNSESVTTYDFIDHEPLTGQHYYRVVQFDIDQKSSNSDVVSVSMHEQVIIDVTPNPTHGHFKVDIFGTSDAMVSVTDLLGREVYSNHLGDHTTFTFGNDLAKGTYLLKIIDAEKVHTEKLIKE